jgi:hypothetical protein
MVRSRDSHSVRKALLTSAVDRAVHGRAFGFERAMDMPIGLGTLALIFMLGGVQVAIEEMLEDSSRAELVDPAQHGMDFGVLATVNGVGDFLSSAMVGLLWSFFGQKVAFGYTAVLFLMGAILVVRVGSVTRSP